MFGPDADGLCILLRGLVPFDEIHLRTADEARDEDVARAVVQFQRAAHLFDHARLQDHDLVGHGHRLDLIMGDVDHRRLQVLVQFGDLKAHVDTQRRVKVRQRFVKEKRRGAAHDGPADGDALALAARQLPRPPVEVV